MRFARGRNFLLAELVTVPLFATRLAGRASARPGHTRLCAHPSARCHLVLAQAVPTRRRSPQCQRTAARRPLWSARDFELCRHPPWRVSMGSSIRRSHPLQELVSNSRSQGIRQKAIGLTGNCSESFTFASPSFLRRMCTEGLLAGCQRCQWHAVAR